MKKIITLWAVAAGMPAAALATPFDLGVLNPTATQNVAYPGETGGIMDQFLFTIAAGDWVQVDFQGLPDGTSFGPIDFSLKEYDTFANLGTWGSWQSPNFSTSFFATKTLTGLTAGTQYMVQTYGWPGGTGSYNLTLTAAATGAGVPEPGGLSLLAVALGLLAWGQRSVKPQQMLAARLH